MKFKKLLRLFLIASFSTIACYAHPLWAQTMSTTATQAILIEATTGDILFEKNSDEQMTPSSMSKLMTIYIAFHKLSDGTINLDDEFRIENTPTWQKWRNQGSTMWLNAGDVVTIHDLLMGIIVQSGNDACAQLALAIAGDVGVFVEMMNEEAVEIGLTNSHFMNTNGWPDPQHIMSAHDIATLSLALATKFPEYYKIFAEKEFRYADVTQANRNRLLYRMDGADGLKTGHTEAGGYGLASSATEDGRRLILVVNGMVSDNARMSESQRLLNYGFRNFNIYNLLKTGQTLDSANVWLGEAPTVPLVSEQDVTISLNRQARRNMTAKIIYDGPIAAPIKKGQPIALLEFSGKNMKTLSYPLVAGADVDSLGGFKRIGAAFNYILMGNAGE